MAHGGHGGMGRGCMREGGSTAATSTIEERDTREWGGIGHLLLGLEL